MTLPRSESHRSTLFAILAVTIVVALIAVMAFASGKVFQADASQQETVTPAQWVDDPTASLMTEEVLPSATSQVDHTTLCPQPSEGTKLYISEEDGYCFLYPEDFKRSEYWPQTGSVTLVAPKFDESKGVFFDIRVMYNGESDASDTSQHYADQWQSIHNWQGNAAASETVAIGGYSAVLIPNMWKVAISERFLSKTAFIVANGQRYRVAIEDHEKGFQTIEDMQNQVWETVVNSIVFFIPASVRKIISAEKVCPRSKDNTKLLIDEASGFCFIYPSDFKPDPHNLSTLTASRVVDGREIQTSFTAVLAGAQEEGTSLLEQASQIDDIHSLEETTIGGLPGIKFVDPRAIPGPIIDGKVAANGFIYSIYGWPYDRNQSSEEANDLDRIWESVTQSIVFFTPVW